VASILSHPRPALRVAATGIQYSQMFKYMMTRMDEMAQNSYDWQAAAESHEQSKKIETLLRHIRFISLANEAMLEIMGEKLGVLESDVAKKMEEIDARDGRPDKRMSSRPVECPRCKWINDSSRPACIYCGAPVEAGEFFEPPFK